MCGIFGYLNYGNIVENKDLKEVLKALSYESTIRGTDATGIAFVNNKGNIIIQKAPKSAFDFKLNFSDSMPKVVIGHTRHTTQGSEKHNFNNHPFQGEAGRDSFALAHNGILYNDDELRYKYKLPETKIKTDSYVAAQLLEQEKYLNVNAMQKMAEAVQGSFCFTILDNSNNLYIVKGDNPVTIIHNKQLKLYLYASTDKILASSVVSSNLLDSFIPTRRNADDIEYINLDDGNIIKIDCRGKTSKATFKQSKCNFNIYDGYYNWPFHDKSYRYNRAVAYDKCNPFIIEENALFEMSYIDDLKSAAKANGYDDNIIDDLLDCGYSFEDVEEYLYQDTCF